MKQFYFIIASTFIMGVVAGVYIYFASRVDPVFDFEGDTSGEIEITADSYGGCMQGGACDSYHIDAEGNYTYLEPQRAGEGTRHEGKLPAAEFVSLKKLLRDTDLDPLASSVFLGECPIAYDGPAFTFTIRLSDEEYIFDTCKQNIKEEPLFKQLVDYFGVLSRVDE